MSQTLAVIDFGSQYTQVIARRVRECSVYSKIYHYQTRSAQLVADGVKGIILSGGPASVFARKAPLPDPKIFECGIPVLGICYGLQLMGHLLGGKVSPSSSREYGHGTLIVTHESPLFHNLPQRLRVWNSHGDHLTQLPTGFTAVAKTDNSPYAAIQHGEKPIYGIQFHPEVFHTEKGSELIRNFLFLVCHFAADWSMANYIQQSVAAIREMVGEQKVILGLSGGVDSSVAAALIHKAIGKQLHCVFVDNGLLRWQERQHVEELFRANFQMNLRVVPAGKLFLSRLRGVTDPERKRKIIGKTFVEVFDQEVARLGKKANVGFLAQGTLYPDVIESVPIEGNPAALIKSHHNVGGLPKKMKLKLLEPLRELFKDEVRRLGVELGLPKEVVWRQPFPGPGLGVRIMGEITRSRLDILRKADDILHQEMLKSEYYYKVWQSFAVFLPVKTVGVMGDERTYEYVIAIRIVESVDAMTADWARLPHDFLGHVANRIINEVKGVNRVVLDISSKPPATIEWE